MFDVDIALAIGPSTLSARIETDARAIVVRGPSGSGKSTFLRALAGLVPARGAIAIGGRSLAGVPPEQRSVGWVPQDARLFPHLSVRENIEYGGADSRSLAERFGIARLLDRMPRNLSGGERQRVAIARAIGRAPLVLLLDEPFAALDAASRDLVATEVERFDALRVLVTHDEGSPHLDGEPYAIRNGALSRR